MTLRVRHVTEYEYADPVELAAHMAHLRPRTLPYQDVRSFTLRVEPAPERVVEGEDHFGNPVAWLLIARPHAGFEAVVETSVETSASAPAVPDPFATPAWETVARAGALAHEAAEFAFGSPLASASEATRAYAAPSFPPGFPVLAGVLDLQVTEVLRSPGGDTAALVAALCEEPAPEKLDYFVCGAPALVATAFHAFDALGVPADQVRTEQFDMA